MGHLLISNGEGDKKRGRDRQIRKEKDADKGIVFSISHLNSSNGNSQSDIEFKSQKGRYSVKEISIKRDSTNKI